jgi:hypothetical protein
MDMHMNVFLALEFKRWGRNTHGTQEPPAKQLFESWYVAAQIAHT